MISNLFLIFGISFLLNLVWENLHARLYVHYKGGKITRLLLARNSLFDASVTTVLALGIFFVPFIKNNIWVVPLAASLFAVALERYALSTGRWAYKPAMPIIPILRVGLTPSIQLGLIAYVTYLVVL